MKQSRTFLLVEKVLDEPLVPFLLRHRKDDRSWPWISELIAQRTGVRVSREALRRWSGETAARRRAA